MSDIVVDGSDLLIVAVVVLWLGEQITSHSSVLQRYSIPLAVTGGLVCSLLVAALQKLGGPRIVFEMEIRDLLLMVFFTTIGLSAKFAKLRTGGKPLVMLVLCAAVFLALQDITGVLIAKSFGVHPAYGLFAGSISLAGGHGTAIAWGQEASRAGLEGAELLGIAFATFGLITGGLIGGPIAEFLIGKNQLDPKPSHDMTSDSTESGSVSPLTLHDSLTILLILSICLSCGELINRWLFANDIKLPGFLTAMLVGIIVTNLADVREFPVREDAFGKLGEISLQLFLAMSLMSMDLLSIAGAFSSIFVALSIQTVVMTVFAVFVVFRVMGSDYDAAVIAGGFCGLGMGATPVAIANMNAITEKYGASFKAFLVIPLVGAFFVDLLNALVIKFFIGLF